MDNRWARFVGFHFVPVGEGRSTRVVKLKRVRRSQLRKVLVSRCDLAKKRQHLLLIERGPPILKQFCLFLCRQLVKLATNVRVSVCLKSLGNGRE